MIYLASTSPRRRRILKEFGIAFKPMAPDYTEENHPHASPGVLVKRHALGKAASCLSRIRQGTIWGVDTIVYCGRKIIGKPNNCRDAFKILGSLQGRWHTVYTGVAVLNVKNHHVQKKNVFFEKTRVRLRPLDHRAMELYFKKINPMDKAGAYAIQFKGANIIAEVKGSLTNAIGLPVERLVDAGKLI
ncbi:MAG: septum formation protein Maf [Candidatus Omnitrophica bacterium CG07_land_8_20_14_0_80_50_8]|nr:MAG: septum formation protein Maf [Candidatus Omnitrophica bacterium CG1_02_49_16]PIU40462.1 MAG: septum formation protein Maf [Candidatus Omnitrophica bacterium CG07_land_8_20_14_0_80_50_8]